MNILTSALFDFYCIVLEFMNKVACIYDTYHALLFLIFCRILTDYLRSLRMQ